MLCGSADEVLVSLKNDRMSQDNRRKEIESLLGPMQEERFALLVNLGKKITDWGADEKMQTGEWLRIALTLLGLGPFQYDVVPSYCSQFSSKSSQKTPHSLAVKAR